MLIAAVNEEKTEPEVTVMCRARRRLRKAIDVKHREYDHEKAFDDGENSSDVASVLQVREIRGS